MAKTYAVLGVGKFGRHIALGLVKNGDDVILCDDNEEALMEFRDKVEQIYILDCTDKVALKEAGISDLDLVIVSIGANIESSILTVMALKELNNKKIIAKAVSSIHGEILEKLGVDEVIYVDKQSAKRVLSEIADLNVEDFELGANVRVCKALATSYFFKRSVGTIHEEDGVRVIAIKRGDAWNLDIDSDFILQRGDVMMFFGFSEYIDKVIQMLESS